MEKKKLNLGCGSKYKEGWINVDISSIDIYGKQIKIDKNHDLNKFPYPFKENEFDIVLLEHTIEHLDEPAKVVKEMERITKSGGIIDIRTPHFSCYHSYRDPTHKWHFSIDSINYLTKNKVTKRILFSHKRIIDFFNSFFYIFSVYPRIYERFLHGILPAQEIIWIINVDK